MRRYKDVLSGLVFLLIGCAAFGQVPSFRAEIKVTRTEVENNETFSVITAIRNTGVTEQSLDIWPCTYPGQWIPNNPIVHVNEIACLKNPLVTIRLKPGKAYERTVPVHIELPSHRGRRGKVTFRLGYGTKTPMGSWKPWPNIPPIWSNPLTVIVTSGPAHEQ